uniref:Uncharacterized protein n=1 Tax=Aegilops tauschii TaxID=37682 RepID=M8BN99_AEGTA
MAMQGGRDDQVRRVDDNDKRRPSWESEQVWQNDIDLLKPSTGPERSSTHSSWCETLSRKAVATGGAKPILRKGFSMLLRSPVGLFLPSLRQAPGAKQTLIGRITSAVRLLRWSSVDIKLDEYFLKADVCSRRVAVRDPTYMGICYFFDRLADRGGIDLSFFFIFSRRSGVPLEKEEDNL